MSRQPVSRVQVRLLPLEASDLNDPTPSIVPPPSPELETDLIECRGNQLVEQARLFAL